MKLSAHQKLTRRDLLKSLGAAALALPALELFGSTARAQTAARTSRFIVFCYTDDGVNQGQFWPSGTPSSYSLNTILKPFEKYKDKLLILGPQMSGSSPIANTGLTYAGPVPQHQAPCILTARAGNLPYLPDQFSAVNRLNGGPSVDQLIADTVGKDTTFRSLNFGLHPIGGDTPSDLNYQSDGMPLKRLASADEAWNHMFGAMNGGGTVTPSRTPLNKLTAVTDYLHARFGALRPAVSAADQKSLDAHLDAMRVYEARAKKRLQDELDGKTPTNPSCSNPSRPTVVSDANSVRTGADTETLAPFFMAMIATAFQCNLTRVASVTFGYPGGGDAGGLRMPWLGFSDPLHFVSHHGGNASKLDKYAKIHAWIASQVAGLMDRLAALPSATGTGTLLDETTIYCFNRHGDGDSHTNYALPNVILGGTGGHFKMGRWLQLPRTNPTQVLISLANAMGVNVSSFGESGLTATSPLAGLTG
jgi:hypothetical protein